jgi:D-beta-D-heptose 7-phosphate kinase/D-beta-D-heptose 1-phosphate adenosyltransferase
VSILLERLYDYKPRIAVFGDAILDEYYDVSADRVSPEFPIPVMKSSKDNPRVVFGGAANVCRQFSNFNFDVSLFALTNERMKVFAGDINMDGCIFSKGVPVKKRFYSDGFPLCRLDIEGDNYNLSPEAMRDLQDKLIQNMLAAQPFDVVVFSDYDKGLLKGRDDLIKNLDESTITIVDPKKHPVERWRGCTIIKPNSMEAAEMSGQSDWRRQCEYFMRKTDCQAVVITQAGDGVVGNVQGGWFEYRPAVKKTPRSVVGAGDAFIAFLSMCMAHSIDIRKAVEISFDACSLYVDKAYNSPLHPYQISPSKLVDPRIFTKRDFTLSFANGCFDILHPGHVELLKFAKSRADKLVVALNSDESVKRQNKSHELVNSLEHRKAMISALECVDFVVSFDEDTPREIMNVIFPEVLVKGSEYVNPVGSDIVGEVCNFPMVCGYSTTSLINKIRSDVNYPPP